MSTKNNINKNIEEDSIIFKGENNPDYQGLHDHIQEYKDKGIPTGISDLIRLYKEYSCPLPDVYKGTSHNKKPNQYDQAKDKAIAIGNLSQKHQINIMYGQQV